MSSWMREDAASIAAGLEDQNPLADDKVGVLAVMLSIIDTSVDQEMTLTDSFTVAHAEEVVEETQIDANWLYDQTESVCRNLVGSRVILRQDEDYPEGLLRMEHPPNILYASGDLGLLDESLMAVVGSRKITSEQAEVIAELGRTVAPVVSGLAPGTDHAAMVAALDDGKPVVGVLGCGLNHPFGPHDFGLARRIEHEGLLLSEYPLGITPVAQRLLRRNEIIAGLCDTFIACVADFRGGTYSGLRRAEKMGVPILAIPGSPALDDWLSRNPDRVCKTETLFPETVLSDGDIADIELPEFEAPPRNIWQEAADRSLQEQRENTKRLQELAERYSIRP